LANGSLIILLVEAFLEDIAIFEISAIDLLREPCLLRSAPEQFLGLWNVNHAAFLIDIPKT
jgi:hypothetical protein